jgi:hypothetical protein
VLTDFLNSPEFTADDADRGVARERQALKVRTPYAAGLLTPTNAFALVPGEGYTTLAANDPVSLRKDEEP